MRYTGPKNRIARRENMDLGMKTPGTKSHANLLKKLNVMPGQHGTRTRRKVSETGKQLREKQKLRYMIGVTDKQMSRYFSHAKAKPGNTAVHLSEYLEKRLDNVLYRLGFAPTRAMARQLITHKHIKVNDRVMNVPSYDVRVGDVVTFGKEKSTKLPAVEQMLEKKDQIIPVWLERKGTAGKLISVPTAELLEAQINLRLVIEFYSR